MASVSRKARSAVGSADPRTASTASANAMSVAIGTAQPCGAPGSARDGEVDSGGDDHAADRGDHRQHGLGGPAQLADDELALELEAGDEEEDRQQPVRRPGGQVEVEVQGLPGR